MRLTNEQRVKSIQLYYQNNNNGAKTARLLYDEYFIPRVQSRNIKSLIRKFESIGSVRDAQRTERPVVAMSLEKSNELQEIPYLSLKCIHIIKVVWTHIPFLAVHR